MSDGKGSKEHKIGNAAPSVVRIWGERREIKREIIEALAHNLGKASQGRFGDHAEASAELLKKAGFSDKNVLHLIGKHHKFEYIRTFLEAKKHNQKLLENVLIKNASQRRFAPIYSRKEARFGLLRDENLNTPIIENHSSFFSADYPAYQTGLPQLHISEVIEGEAV